MEDFFKEASFDDALVLVTLRYGNLVKEGESFMDTLGQLGQGGRYQDIGSLLKRVGIGTAVGAGGGLASTMLEPEHRRRPLSRAMTGAMLGALGGGAYHALDQYGSQLRPSSAAPEQVQDEAQQALQGYQDSGTTPGARAGSVWNKLIGGDVGGAASDASDAVTGPIKQWMQGGTVSPEPGQPTPTPAADKSLLANPLLPVGAGATGYGVDAAMRAGKYRLTPENRTSGINRMLADPEVKNLTEGQKHQLEKAREQLLEGGNSQRAADRALLRHGTGAPEQLKYKADMGTHAADVAKTQQANDAAQKQHVEAQQTHATAVRNRPEALAAAQREATNLQASIARRQAAIRDAVSQANTPEAWARVHEMAQMEAPKIKYDQARLAKIQATPYPHPQAPTAPTPQAMPVAPQRPSRVPANKDHLAGKTLKQKMRHSRPDPGGLRRWGRTGLMTLAPALLTQGLQEAAYGNTSEAMQWRQQQLEQRLRDAEAAVRGGQ